MTRHGRYVVLAAGVIAIAIGVPAQAELTNDRVSCQGSADLVDKTGKHFPIDANQDRVKVPRNGEAHWKGSVTPATHDHTGFVDVDLGFIKVRAGEWKSANKGNVSVKEGTKVLPDAMKYVPPGIYTIRGEHRGREGGCSGSVEIDLQGGIFSTPAGFVSVGGTLLAGLGLLMAGRPTA